MSRSKGGRGRRKGPRRHQNRSRQLAIWARQKNAQLNVSSVVRRVEPRLGHFGRQTAERFIGAISAGFLDGFVRLLPGSRFQGICE